MNLCRCGIDGEDSSEEGTADLWPGGQGKVTQPKRQGKGGSLEGRGMPELGMRKRLVCSVFKNTGHRGVCVTGLEGRNALPKESALDGSVVKRQTSHTFWHVI